MVLTNFQVIAINLTSLGEIFQQLLQFEYILSKIVKN